MITVTNNPKQSISPAGFAFPPRNGYLCRLGLYSLIPLTQGKVAIIDKEDFEWLSQYKWYALKRRKTYYATRHIKGTKRVMFMHRQILGLRQGDKKLTDHHNHNGLDNRKYNIRICTDSENQGNRISKPTGKSKYRGVRWYNNKWAASIGKNRSHIGYYKSEIEAAKAYDRVAKKRFGEFAYTNFQLSSLVRLDFSAGLFTKE